MNSKTSSLDVNRILAIIAFVNVSWDLSDAKLVMVNWNNGTAGTMEQLEFKVLRLLVG